MKGIARTPLPVLWFGKHKVPLTPDELTELERLLAQWVEAKGVCHGFV